MAQPIPYYDNEYDPMREPREVITEEKQPMSEKPVKVKVIDRWRVVNPHDGKAHTKGDTLTVPEHLAEEWERNRWVERVTGK